MRQITDDGIDRLDCDYCAGEAWRSNASRLIEPRNRVLVVTTKFRAEGRDLADGFFELAKADEEELDLGVAFNSMRKK